MERSRLYGPEVWEGWIEQQQRRRRQQGGATSRPIQLRAALQRRGGYQHDELIEIWSRKRLSEPEDWFQKE